MTLVQPNIKLYGFNQTSLSDTGFTIQSDNVAPFVMLSSDIAGRFSDNGFLLLPGQEVSLEVYGWSDFNLSDFVQSLSVKTIADTLS